MTLAKDEMLGLALARAMEIIGEAAARISGAGRAEVDLPWPKIVGVRNRLVHAYFDIDQDLLWKAATRETPAILAPLLPLVRDD